MRVINGLLMGVGLTLIIIATQHGITNETSIVLGIGCGMVGVTVIDTLYEIRDAIRGE